MHEPASTIGARLDGSAAAIEARGSDRDVVARLIIELAREKGESTGVAIARESGVDIVQRGPRGIGTREGPGT